MKTREDIVKEINGQKWNQNFDNFILEEVKYKEERDTSKFPESPYEEVIEIEDCYVLTRFVMVEKNPYRNGRFDAKHWTYYNKEKHYKLIIKRLEDGTFKRFSFDIKDKQKYLVDDYDKLQKELELKKHNVLYDGYDLNQVIKYYENE